MSDFLVQCTGLSKSYGGAPVLDQLSFELPAGRIVGLLGPNGTGKTTLIKLLAGLLRPTSGSILIDGHAPGAESKAVVSYLPDRLALPDWMKALDLVNLYEDFYADFDRARAQQICDLLRIRPEMRLKTMSKGTREKMQLALTMSRRARLYLLDEPIAGVDPAARDFILDTIMTHHAPGSTVLLSTHLIGDIEKILDDVMLLSDGRLFLHESADVLRRREGCSVDEYFRRVYRVAPQNGGM